MATNKHALIRYKILDKCFSNKWRSFFIEDLIEYCSKELSDYIGSGTKISRRQLLDDITFMRSETGYQAPIVSYKDGRRVFYRYNPIEFSILKQPLNESEQEQIRLALETLGRVKGIPQLEWLNTVQAKLTSGLALDSQISPIISFEENEFLKGLEYLEPIYQYIVHKCILEISYKSYRQEEITEQIIHPYYLKQYNNRWFLFGMNRDTSILQNLALDRIKHIEVATTSTFVESNVDFDEYFEDIIGVSNNPLEEVKSIKIKLSTDIIPYINSKPIHGSQKLQGDLLYLEVKLNYELEAVILSYGEKMQVLEPQELVEKMRTRIQKSFSFY